MDDKARFQDTLTQLERHLFDYKNCFPKNVWQIVSTDLPIITLVVASYITIKLVGLGLMSILILGPLFLAMIIVLVNKESLSAWKDFITKRANYKKELKNIKEKIQNINIKEFEQYPDVNNYLHTFNQELKAETERKKAIKRKYYTIIMSIYSILIIAILLTFKMDLRVMSDDKLEAKNKIDKDVFESLHITKTDPIATIKPLNDESVIIINEIVPGSKSKNLCLFLNNDRLISYMPTIKGSKCTKFRIIITDFRGHPANGMPIFDFDTQNRDRDNGLIQSANIATELESYKYETFRRVRYLQENADNLRYVIEGLD